MKRFPEQEAGTSLFVLSPTLAANQVGDVMIGRYDLASTILNHVGFGDVKNA
jgi:hypothetical protein